MATFAILALKNAAAATVNFAQLSRDKISASWCENLTAAMNQWRIWTVSNKVPAPSSKAAYRAQSKLTYPVLNVTTQQTSNILFVTDVVVPQDVALTDVNEAIARFRAGVGDATFTDLVTNKTIPF